MKPRSPASIRDRALPRCTSCGNIASMGHPTCSRCRERAARAEEENEKKDKLRAYMDELRCERDVTPEMLADVIEYLLERT